MKYTFKICVKTTYTYAVYILSNIGGVIFFASKDNPLQQLSFRQGLTHIDYKRYEGLRAQVLEGSFGDSRQIDISRNAKQNGFYVENMLMSSKCLLPRN